MRNRTHETAPTQFVETNGIRYAYRRFGKPGTVPLLFLGYFNSNMDAWDPQVTNRLAADHEVILFDNAGIGEPGGETPDTRCTGDRASRAPDASSSSAEVRAECIEQLQPENRREDRWRS